MPAWRPGYPYGRAITPQALARVDQAETFLAALGFRQYRVRDHHPVARVEVAPDELDLAWRERAAIAARLHEIGYPYVALDLDGFRSGSLNEVLPDGARETDKGPVLGQWLMTRALLNYQTRRHETGHAYPLMRCDARPYICG